jgi:transposase
MSFYKKFPLVETSMSYLTDLTDAQWELVGPIVTPQTPQPGPKADLRTVVNALLYQTKTGCHWRLIPKDFGHWSAIRYFFDKWKRSGVLQNLLEELNRAVREKRGPRPPRASSSQTRKAPKQPRAARP